MMNLSGHNPTMGMTSNVEVAIMNRINDLGRRFGLEPWEFNATYRSEDGSVSFQLNPSDPAIAEKQGCMLKALGCDEKGKIPSPNNDEQDIFLAIEAVMSGSPKVWSR